MIDRPTIRGTTRLYAIIGDPIAQVRSPQTFTDAFANAGVDAVMLPAHVPAERFDAVVPSLMALANLDGLLVTIPFKARAARLADRLGATAACIGAVNALRRERDGSWSGDMFDGEGFVQAAKRKGERLEGRRVVLYGAGGAGSAIACALSQAGVRSIDVIDVDADKARSLVAKLASAFADCAFVAATSKRADADMIVNASPVGMAADDALPADLGVLAPGTLVGDVVNADRATPMIRHATRCGCSYVEGREMHAGQRDAILAFFGFGAR